MGYTHYWYRDQQLDQQAFSRAVVDIKEVFTRLGTMGVKLAGSHGEGASTINDDLISFNGVSRCGHKERDLGITWPAPEAGGIGSEAKGHWFGGAFLTERTCDGDCSHETFYVERNMQLSEHSHPDKTGRYFEFCKTAYKPYDLAVTAALIILQHYLGNAIKLSSDGEDNDWRDAAMICQMVLGYGATFKLPEEATQ